MIRKMKRTRNDVDAIVDIWLKASLRAHHFIDAEFWENNTAPMRDIYIPNSETWVIEEQGSVAGFYSFAGETLAAIFVDPDCQGKGLGKQLLNHAKSGRKHIELAVYTENKPSHAFYCKHGFTVVREQVDENTGHSEYVMEWRA